MRTLQEGPSGVGTYLRNLVPALLAAAPADRFLLAFSGSRPPDAFQEWRSANWEPLAVRAAPKPVWEQVLLPAALARRQIDVFHRPGGPGGLLRRVAGGPRVVVTIHDLIPLIFPADYFRHAGHRVFYRFQLLLSTRFADAVITVSETVRRDVVERLGLPPARVTTVTEAVDAALRAPAPGAADPGVPGPYLLAIGGAEPRKNLPRVLEAFARLAPDVPHHLALVGGPWRGRTLDLSRQPAPLRARIHDLGTVSPARLRALYTAADCFVYPSLYEGFGLPLLEAMTLGAPVVTSRAGSLPEVAADAAQYADAGDAGSIAAAVAQVLNDPARRRTLIERGRARAASFSWDDAARRTLSVYASVAAAAIER